MTKTTTKRALLVVDIQNDYFPGGKWTLHGIEEASDKAARLIDAARSDHDLIVFVRHENPTAEAPFFAAGSEGAKINEKIRTLKDDPIVTKHHINAFRETNLKDILDKNGINEVVICGAMSHMCVDAVARASNDFGYKVTVVHDACASRDLEFNDTTIAATQVHEAFMSALGFGYATMRSTEEYVRELELAKTTK
jgi:nicotinamidase-related amidase